ncbi:hypothetical protein GE21DRAFT_1321748, partial [Neurospora crassa]
PLDIGFYGITSKAFVTSPEQPPLPLYTPKSQDGDLSWWCDLCDIGWADEYGLNLHERRSYGHRVKQAERQGLPPPPKPERG